MQKIHQLTNYQANQVTGRGIVLVASLRANGLLYKNLAIGDTIQAEHPGIQYQLRGIEASRVGGSVHDTVGLLVSVH